MIAASERIVTGPFCASASPSTFNGIERLLSRAFESACRRCALRIVLAMASLNLFALQVHVVRAADPPGDRSGVSKDTQKTGTPLPAQALVRLGTENLRMRRFVRGIAFSQDGRLFAADSNSETPSVSVFEVQTGGLLKQIRSPDKPQGWVQCVEVSSDGTKLLWGEGNGHVALWDLSNDQMLFRGQLHGGKGLANNVVVDLAAYTGTVNDVAFSPDGTLFATASIDGTIHVRRVVRPAEVVRDFNAPWSPTGRPNRMMPGLGPPPGPQPGLESARCLAFMPDGKRLIVGSGTTISIWRIEDGQLERRITKAHGNRKGATAGSLESLAVTPDGRRIMSAGSSTLPSELTTLKTGFKEVTLTEVRLWDSKTGQLLSDLSADDVHGRGAAVLSGDGQQIAVADHGAIRILRVDTGKVEQTIALPGWRSDELAISPDGLLVARPFDNTIGLFNVKTGQRVNHEAATPDGYMTSAAWSPTGDRIVTGHEDGITRVWDAQTGRLLWNKALSQTLTPYDGIHVPRAVAFSSDGRRVVAAGGADLYYGTVAIYEASRGLLVREVDQKEIPVAALSPDRRIVIAANLHRGSHALQQLHALDVETGQTLWISPAAEQQGGWSYLRWMQFQPGSTLVDAVLGSGDIVRLDSLTGKEQRRVRVAWPPPDPGKPAARRGRLARSLGEAALSADGRTLASISDKTVRIWDVETGKQRHTIPHAFGDSSYLALTSDGKTLATSVRHYLEPATEDLIRIYDVETGELLLTLDTPGDRAIVLAFSPDGTKLLSGFHKGSAIVWDVRRTKKVGQPSNY